MSTATFKPYDMSNSEADLHSHAGERVTVGAPVDLGHDEFRMFDVLTADGLTLQAFEDELSEWSEE